MWNSTALCTDSSLFEVLITVPLSLFPLSLSLFFPMIILNTLLHGQSCPFVCPWSLLLAMTCRRHYDSSPWTILALCMSWISFIGHDVQTTLCLFSMAHTAPFLCPRSLLLAMTGWRHCVSVAAPADTTWTATMHEHTTIEAIASASPSSLNPSIPRLTGNVPTTSYIVILLSHNIFSAYSLYVCPIKASLLSSLPPNSIIRIRQPWTRQSS